MSRLSSVLAVTAISAGLLFYCAEAKAQPTNNSIGGMVLDTSNRPLSNLQVELLDEVEQTVKRTRTDGSGRYLFSGLTKGNFYVRVLTYGTNFVSQTTRVSVVVLSAVSGSGNTHEEQNFVLKTVDEEKTGRIIKPAVIFSQDVPEAARKHYQEGIERLNDGRNINEGVEELRKAIEIFPNYYLALERLGSEYVKQGRHGDALDILDRAIKVNPKGHASFYALGIAQYNLKRMQEAEASLRNAVSLAPNSANSQLWLGIVLFKAGKQTEAEKPLKTAYELAGKQVPDVHMFLAQIYSNTKRYKEAADELDRFLKEAPDAKDAEKIKGLIKQLRAKSN